jgi:hypothetical protein
MYTSRLIQLPPNLVQVEDTKPQDELFDHVKYYHSKSGGVPAIQIKIEDGVPVLTRGLEYFNAAKDLGYSPIRAIVSLDTSDNDLDRLLANESVARLDVGQLNADELAAPVDDAWQVFYFERPLSPVEKEKFRRDVVATFETLSSGFLTSTSEPRVRFLVFSDSPSRIEFKAYVPIYDEEWLLNCVARFRAFSERVVRIVSYQGRRIPAQPKS